MLHLFYFLSLFSSVYIYFLSFDYYNNVLYHYPFSMQVLRCYLFLTLILTILWCSCNSEDPDSSQIYCDPTSIKLELNKKSVSNRFIVNITADLEVYTILFDDGTIVKICKDAVKKYQYDNTQWQVEFTFIDNTELLINSKGKISINASMNPFGRNPLCALATLKAKREGKVKINIIGKYGEESNLMRQFEEIDTLLEIPILGLYENHTNSVEITFLSRNNHIIDIDTLLLETPKIVSINPNIEIIKKNKPAMEFGEFHLVSSLSYWGPNIVYMFDTYGEIRWLINYKNSDLLKFLSFDVGVEQLHNGNLYFGDKRSNAIYEVDFFGTILNSWPLSEHTFHHNVVEKPDGNFLITVNRPESKHNNGKSTKEDYVIEIDRKTNTIIKEWDFKQLLDENRSTLGQWEDESPVDWIHINAVVYSEKDNTIIVSGRHQGIIKVDYNDNVRWILAPHRGWGQNRMGQDCNSFLLTAVNSSSLPLNQDVQEGEINGTDFEWPWYQHAPELLPSGNILVFDNGSSRNFGNNTLSYSRAVEYHINEDKKTVQQIWQYGKERGNETFAEVLSDVDYLPTTGNILFSPGMRIFNGTEFKGGRIVELDYNTKEVFFEAYIGSPGLTFHRVERMSLY